MRQLKNNQSKLNPKGWNNYRTVRKHQSKTLKGLKYFPEIVYGDKHKNDETIEE